MSMISLKHLNKLYNEEVVALADISLNIERGEIFGVIGRSGAGKSTLLRCVNCLERPDSGDIIVDEQSMLELSAENLRQARHHIGMIFQHFNLLSSRTVYDNIALPLELSGINAADISLRVQPLLELTGLADRADHYPSQLSGGQKQRVAIARALASEPKVLLCDEATSALDPETTQAILDLLKKINREMGITIMLITHEMHVVKSICHRVALMEKGRLVEVSDTVDLFLAPQSLLAQTFVSTALKRHLPPLWQARITSAQGATTDHHVWRILFRGEITEQPLINMLVEKFDLTINILQASIDTINDVIVGIMIVAVDGADDALENAKQFLNQQSVNVEQIGYVA